MKWTPSKVAILMPLKQFSFAFSIRRDAEYAHSDITVLDNIFIFEVGLKPLLFFWLDVKGEENPFILSRVYDVDWICEYNMAWYPFDTQSCSMIFEVGSISILSTKTDFLRRRETLGSLSSLWSQDLSTLVQKSSPNTSSRIQTWPLGSTMTSQWPSCWAGYYYLLLITWSYDVPI